MYKFTHAIILSRGEYDTIIKVDGCLDWDMIIADDFITHALIAEHSGHTIQYIYLDKTTESSVLNQIEGFMAGVNYLLPSAEYEEHKAIYIYDTEDYVDPDSFAMSSDILNQYQQGKAVWQD